MTEVEGRSQPPLYYRFECDCGFIVQTAENWQALEKVANSHTRKCKFPSRQQTSVTPFVIVPEEAGGE